MWPISPRGDGSLLETHIELDVFLVQMRRTYSSLKSLNDENRVGCAFCANVCDDASSVYCLTSVNYANSYRSVDSKVSQENATGLLSSTWTARPMRTSQIVWVEVKLATTCQWS